MVENGRGGIIKKLLSFYAEKENSSCGPIIIIPLTVVTADLVLSPCSLLLSVHVLIVFEIKSGQGDEEAIASL